MTAAKSTIFERKRADLERQALDMAAERLAPFAHDCDHDISLYVEAILDALKQVKQLEQAANKGRSSDEFVPINNYLHIVATALMAVTGGIDIAEVNPYAVGALPFLGLAKAASILEVASNLVLITDDLDDTSSLGDSIGHAIGFLRLPREDVS